MNFIVDAQLPRRLARQLVVAGHDAVHTLQLPRANQTPDGDITALAIREDRVVVTKDEDFVVAFWLHGPPPKLLLVSTGNISNDALEHIVAANLKRLTDSLTAHSFVELTASTVIIHA